MRLTPTPEQPAENSTLGTILAQKVMTWPYLVVPHPSPTFTYKLLSCSPTSSEFTAWSSVREPSQVFTLLATAFREFDQLANSQGVFKVETVGDCYVAVSGLPEPNKVCKWARRTASGFN
jgi:hypothetical protein